MRSGATQKRGDPTMAKPQPAADDVRAALNAADYPASKDDLIAAAQDAGADEEVLRALRTLPLQDYNNEGEVLRSVPLEGAGG